MKSNAISICQPSEEIIQKVVDETTTEISLRLIDEPSSYMEELAEALKKNKSVTYINISVGELSLKAIKTLGEVLKASTRITEFKMYLEYLESDGAKHLLEGIAQNESITKIALHCDKLCSEEQEHLLQNFSELLKIKTSITSIELGCYNMSFNKAAGYLAGLLKENKRIIYISIWGDTLEPEAFEAMLEPLKENKALINIDYWFKHRELSPDHELVKIYRELLADNLKKFNEQCEIILKNDVTDPMKGIPIDERKLFVSILKKRSEIYGKSELYQHVFNILEASRTFHLLGAIGVSSAAMAVCTAPQLPNEIISIISTNVSGDINLRSAEVKKDWVYRVMDEGEKENSRACGF